MNTIQSVLTSILAVALVAAFPGLYFSWAGNDVATGGSNGAVGPVDASTNWSVDSSDLEKVRIPDPSELPNTPFELKKLSAQERKQVLWDLMIDINKASKQELQKISGVGPATAQNIIDYRNQHGGFRTIDDLQNVSGIGPATVQKMRSSVKVSNASTPGNRTISTSHSTSSSSSSSSHSGPKINVNTASSSELQQITGVGPATAEKIITYRNENGNFSRVEDLQNVSGIGPATAEKMRGQVTF